METKFATGSAVLSRVIFKEYPLPCKKEAIIRKCQKMGELKTIVRLENITEKYLFHTQSSR